MENQANPELTERLELIESMIAEVEDCASDGSKTAAMSWPCW